MDIQELTEIIRQYFTSCAWSFQVAQDTPQYQLLVWRANLVHSQVTAGIYVSQSRLLCFIDLPFVVSPVHRGAMAEAITRANYHLTTGTFKMDLDSGEIFFATSLYLGTMALTTRMVEYLVRTNLETVDIYLPKLEQVAASPMEPATAYRHDERKEDAVAPAPAVSPCAAQPTDSSSESNAKEEDNHSPDDDLPCESEGDREALALLLADIDVSGLPPVNSPS